MPACDYLAHVMCCFGHFRFQMGSYCSSTRPVTCFSTFRLGWIGSKGLTVRSNGSGVHLDLDRSGGRTYIGAVIQDDSVV